MGVEDYVFRPMDVGGEIKPFHCTNDDLNDFLRDDAKKYLSDLMAVTYLLEDNANGKTVAYFSLLNDKIVSDPEQRKIWNRLSRGIANSKRRRSYPSVKIGRLAVSEEYSRCGIGRDIIIMVKHMFTHGNKTGCRFVTVDAYKDAVGFYRKCGFDFISEGDRNDDTRLMYYDLKSFLHG